MRLCVQMAATRWDKLDRCRPNDYYGGLPADDQGTGTQGLEVGTLEVTFPPGHARGKIERPLQVFSFSLSEEDPEEHVIISELRSFGADHAAWVRELGAAGRDDAFIYVHGFETTFDQAARRAAQLAYDLDFDLQEDFRGVPMMFSWPSRGGIKAYAADYDASFESIDAFNLFLDLVKKQAGIRRVHVIAHSMGNRVVTEALYARRQREPLVDQLVLAAPDVWASRFRNRFLRALPGFAARVTLYVSDHDRALITSREIREGEARAGEVAGGLLEASRGVDRFDAINASLLRTDVLGHGYYASQGSMLGDVYCLLKGAPAKGRPLLVLAGAGWQFRPPEELERLSPTPCVAAVVPAAPVTVPPAFPWPSVGAAVIAGAALLLLALRWRRRNRPTSWPSATS
jgi:esterase/lipase superfamily enzyme